jgi:ArsR family transcriptional regulator
MKSIQYLKTISNETKLRLVSLLLENELCVCELEEITNIKQANISKNLNSLNKAGIVDVRRDKQRAFYFLSEEFMSNTHLIEHFRELKISETLLIDDHNVFMKHEDVKDKNVYVCNVFREEAS